ncbi:MAG: hypothetical protein ONB05_10410, partial [candidate division KSB1 bacterium]|nr:hypothetical protein [candidate division KSB1 bacterium]
NLHKVKGLEAPVIFLADPSGEYDHGVDLHIDRSKDKVEGFMMIRVKIGEYYYRTIARPSNWEAWEQKEKSFKRAEELRLRYVAATRAGSTLIITRRMGKKGKKENPWQYFEQYIHEENEIEYPGEQKAPRRKDAALSENEVKGYIILLMRWRT